MLYYYMYVMGKFRKKYFNQIPEDNKQYLKSRRAFTVDGITALTILSMTLNSYLSGFLQFIGVSASFNGIISAIPTLAALSQPFGAAFGQKFKKKKLLVCIGAILHRTMLTLMFVVPFFVHNITLKITLVVALFFGAHFIGSFISPAATNWLISLTPQRLRGRYFSLRELYCVVVSAVVCLGAGYMLDIFNANSNQAIGYLWYAVILGVLTIANFISLTTVMEPESVEQPTNDISLLQSFALPFKEKLFRPIIIMSIIWNLGIQVAVPYWGLYMVSDLAIPYATISIIGIICGFVKAFSVRWWGRIADEKSWAFVCKVSISIIATTHIVNMFLVSSNKNWIFPVSAIIANVGWAVIGIAFINIQYDFAPVKGRTMYIGVNAAVTGIIGFSGVFIGAFIMEVVAKYNLVFWGLPIKGQQILMLISGMLLFTCAIYIHFVVQKNKKIINRTEGIAV